MMSGSPRSLPATNSNDLAAIFWAGLAAGVLDLSFAIVSFAVRGKGGPDVLLKSVAGGAFGPSAQQGGGGMVALGLLFHFVISFGAATVYYAASRKLSLVRKHVWISGLVFGLLVYEFMHLVVLPLSAYHSRLVFPPLLVADVLSHLFFVGLTIALIVRRYSGGGRAGIPNHETH